MRQWLLLVFLLLSTSVFARVFPANSHIGEVVEIVPNSVTIAKKTYRTAPGLRVFTENNALIFIHNLPVGTTVGYQLDLRGELFQIWVLSTQEISNWKTN